MMKRIILITTLSSVMMLCQAEKIFESIDEKGITAFSDAPIPGNQNIRVFDINTQKTAAMPAQPAFPSMSMSPPSQPAAAQSPQKAFEKKMLALMSGDDNDQQTSVGSAHDDLIAAYKSLDLAKQQLQEKISAYQEAQDTLDSLSPSATAQIQQQQQAVSLAEAAVTAARAHLTQIEGQVALEEDQFAQEKNRS